MTPARGFASDNSATVHPEVLAAIAAVNTGHVFGYGHDEHTRRVERLFAEHFGADARAFLVFNGTAANVLSLRAACRPWDAAICADTAHLNVDECGAPESIAGVKLLTVEAEDGKVSPEQAKAQIERVGDEHAVQPRVISISQPTELGTLYTAAEIAELAELAHANRMVLHVDGARLANAAAALGTSLKALSTDLGVDILSFGGTKNGLLGAEAVVLLSPGLADGFEYLRKQSLQLASKMRFLAAQFEALLANELWLRCATNANAMAARLAAAVRDTPSLTITRPVQTNAVFARIAPAATQSLQQQFPFYVWDERSGEVRWMCSWDTTEDDVDGFAGAVHQAVARYQS